MSFGLENAGATYQRAI
jgi:hypothetical protein